MYNIFHKIIKFRYKNALNLRLKVQLSLEQKNVENAIITLKTIFDEFKSAVCNKSVM